MHVVVRMAVIIVRTRGVTMHRLVVMIVAVVVRVTMSVRMSVAV